VAANGLTIEDLERRVSFVAARHEGAYRTPRLPRHPGRMRMISC
jgi:hypothetical protein